jgi:hypothetical protein
MCTRNFDPLKDWSEEERKKIMDFLKAKKSKDATRKPQAKKP